MRLDLPLAGDRVRLEERPGSIAIVRIGDGLNVGRVDLEEDGDTLTVRVLCIDEPHRSYGCGSETGYLLVNGAAAAGYERLRAWAPPDRGLAVYFWFRMGLHPLHGEGPEGGIWLERHLRRPPVAPSDRRLADPNR